MKMKLAMAAALVAGTASAAGAADLGRPAPAAVDYVKVCDAYGAGFFYIPGSSTCLKIGGYVQFRGFVGGDNASAVALGGAGVYRPATIGRGMANNLGRARNNATTSTEASLTLDARSNTELGLLRSFVDARWTLNSGLGVATGFDKAFIQFGGLTAGYAGSFFNFFTGASLETTFEPFWSDHSTNLLAYTFAFGNGVSATVSIEDPTLGGKRQQGNFLLTAGGVPFGAGVATPAVSYGGHKTPDVVANLNITQAWGSAQIMGVLHQNYDASAAPVFGDKWGYAIGAGVNVNLPSIGVGDYVALQAGYTQGAVQYLGLGGLANDYVRTTVAGVNGIGQTKAWSVNGGFHHGFSKTVAFDIDLGYANVDHFGQNDFNVFRVSSDVIWTPVTNLDIGLGVEYQSLASTGATKAAYTAAYGAGSTLGDESGWTAVLHIKRKF